MWIMITGVLLSLGFANPSTDPSIAGWVVEIKGSGTVTDEKGVKFPLSPDFKIAQGSIIATQPGAKVRVMFVDQSVIDIGESSSVLVKRADKTTDQVDLKLNSGTMRALVRKKISSKTTVDGLPTGFRVRTPSITMGVRGTDFYVRSFTEGKSMSAFCAVNSGSVMVSVPGTNKPLELRPGATFMVNAVAQPGGAPPVVRQAVQGVATPKQKEFLHSDKAMIAPTQAEKAGMPAELSISNGVGQKPGMVPIGDPGGILQPGIPSGVPGAVGDNTSGRPNAGPGGPTAGGARPGGPGPGGPSAGGGGAGTGGGGPGPGPSPGTDPAKQQPPPPPPPATHR